jgi:hypothetical protein
MKPVTAWSRFYPKCGKFLFNHIGNGHNTTGKPTPVSDAQEKNWSGHDWIFCLAWLDEHGVVVYEEQEEER